MAASAKRKRRGGPRKTRPLGTDGGGGMAVTVYTEEIAALVCEMIERGNYVEVSARYAGIARRTFYDWCRRGRDGEEPFAGFVERLDRAQARAEVKLLDKVEEAGKGDWTAAMTRLERRFPERWGRRARVDVGNPEGEVFRVGMEASEYDAIPEAKLRELKTFIGELRALAAAGETVDGEAEDAEFAELGP